jgi:dimethylaniline monooxygenase (N-oxide forming)
MDRVCVIGAGSSGIAACQVLGERGIDYDCFEAGSQVGGNWRYLNDNGMSSAYRSLHINTSRTVMEYSTYPMPTTLPNYPNHFQIAEYFDSYVDHFGFRDRIRFRTEVVSVVPADGGWDVTTRSRDTDERSTTRYRAVLVANGHHWDPRWPEPAFPGHFDGEQTHAHHYKEPEPFRGRRVLVLGIGNSAADIAVETSSVSERTFLAMRRGAWVLPKYLLGRPFDALAKTPFTRLPLPVQRAVLMTSLRLAQGRMTDYGLPEPDHRPLEAHPTVSADLLNRLGHGDITVKPDIERFDGPDVVFTDGSRERIDVVVYCTGYRISFPFLDPSVVSAADNRIGLFHRVVDPEHSGLYFMGLVQPLGAIMPIAEAQARWVADLLDGTAVLPPVDEMRREIARYQRATAARYVASKRHTIQVDFMDHLRALATERRAGATRATRAATPGNTHAQRRLGSPATAAGLVYHRQGSGEPLLLVHGLGSRWQVWRPVIDRLSEHHDVIAMDLPGFGASEPGDTPPTLDGLVTAVQKFTAELGIERPHVAGNSLGGGIALELGRRGAARTVTAFSPIGFWRSAGRYWGRGSLTASRNLGERVPRELAARLAISPVGRTALLSLFFGRPWRLDPATVLGDVQALVGSRNFVPVRDSLRDHVFVANSAIESIPVTIAWGTRDALLTYRTQSRHARVVLPTARHVALPGCGHLPFADDPALCATVLLDTTREKP